MSEAIKDNPQRAIEYVPLADFLNPEEGWSLYRSFSSADQARWYFDRLPDEENRVYKLVAHPSRNIIVCREVFTHRN